MVAASPGGQPETLLLLRFVGAQADAHSLSAESMAECLQGFVELSELLTDAGFFGGGDTRATLRVEPPREGSFEIPLWAGLQSMDYALWEVMLGGTGVAGVLGLGYNLIRNVVIDGVASVEPFDDAHVTVTFRSGNPQVITKRAWDLLQGRPRRTRRALRAILAALGEDATRLDMTAGNPGQDAADLHDLDPVATADRSDYRAAADADEGADDDPDESVFTATGGVVIADFRTAGRWRIQIPGHPERTATMLDSNFQQLLDRHEVSLGKGDSLNMTIHEVMVPQEGRIRRKWSIIKVNDYPGRGIHDEPPSPEG